MRLQLIPVALLFSSALCAQETVAFDSLSGGKSKPVKYVDVNFLFSYYDQDGDHSAVTGGIGTQKLEDYASKIIINVPIDTATELSFNAHVNYYSSASTDRINENISSASRKDIHGQIDLGYQKANVSKSRTLGFMAGGAIESDYISSSLGGKWIKSSRDYNREFSLKAMAYFDAMQLIFPDELRATAYRDVSTDKRRTFSLSITYSQSFTKRLQASFTTDLIYQNGLLSTPFHRVYFKDSEIARIEKLPGDRIKFPLGIRLNYFTGEFLVTRFYYRFYYDNFGILANTFSIELPFRIRQKFSLYPFYRFHAQRASDYFAPYGQHEPDALFYISDYDLSAFTDHKVGAGFGYYPQAGIVNVMQEKKLLISYFGVRYANYFRSDGLRAFTVSLHLGIRI